jgi:hypothetical protein
LLSQKDPESKTMRNQQQRNNDSRNEVSRSQLPCQESCVIGLVEGVKEIGKTPQIKDPGDGNAGPTWFAMLVFSLLV